MTSAQREVIDKRIKAGEAVSQGVLPALDPISAYYANTYFTLRAATPPDQPVALPSLALLVGREDALFLLPYIQLMDEAYFEDQTERRNRAMQQAKKGMKPSKPAPAAGKGRGRRRK